MQSSGAGIYRRRRRYTCYCRNLPWLLFSSKWRWLDIGVALWPSVFVIVGDEYFIITARGEMKKRKAMMLFGFSLGFGDDGRGYVVNCWNWTLNRVGGAALLWWTCTQKDFYNNYDFRLEMRVSLIAVQWRTALIFELVVGCSGRRRRLEERDRMRYWWRWTCCLLLNECESLVQNGWICGLVVVGLTLLTECVSMLPKKDSFKSHQSQ